MLEYDREREDALAFEADNRSWPAIVTEQFLLEVTNPNPDLCRCGGSGLIVGPYDSEHVCPWHKDGFPHDDSDSFWTTLEGASLLATCPF